MVEDKSARSPDGKEPIGFSVASKYIMLADDQKKKKNYPQITEEKNKDEAYCAAGN